MDNLLADNSVAHTPVADDCIAHEHHDVNGERWNTFAVLSDDALRIRVQAPARPHVEVWLPFSGVETQTEDAGQEDSAGSAVTLRMVQAIVPETIPASASVSGSVSTSAPTSASTSDSTLRLGGVHAVMSESDHTVSLYSSAGIATGRIALHARDAYIDVLTNVTPSRHSDVSAMLTLSTALLMNRLDRALMHAAAIAPPDGDAWLLVGDTHSGKTTTTLNLVVAGWSYLSDDHVVLSRDESGAPLVEGWPRTFHLDAGWEDGTPRHHRVDFDPRQFATAHRSGCTKLGGVLFPVVVPNEPTRLIPITGARALTAFVRQSPWLMADRHAARSALTLFTTMTRLPTYELRLGLDTFNNPDLLAERLTALTVKS